MPDLLHQGGLIVAIKKVVKDNKGKPVKGPGGKPVLATVPAFSYGPNNGLAQLIVDAWANQSFRDQLLAREADKITVTPAAVQLATWSVNNAGGFNLKRAVVISEVEHDNDYLIQNDDEVVFVLPRESRVFAGAGGLLEFG